MPLHKHTSSPLKIKVAKLWTSPEGTSQKFPLDVKLEYPAGEINAVSNFTGELMLIKLKDEISAIISDAEVEIGFRCNRCLTDFIATVRIPGAEREFVSRKPALVDDLCDIHLIDMKDLTIDLSEMVRQEIILHFPFIPVCSNGCKGLCPVCGKNRNQRPCGCKQEDTETYRPFNRLKIMMKEKS
jgi:uncharacterized metal-binding protein YceD (DUF177 family)